MTDRTPSTPSAATVDAGTPTYFAWHPVYQGRPVDSVRREVLDDLRRDQRAYDLALQAAEQNESASLQSILKLDNRWSPFDLGWTEADPAQLASYVVAVELERERQQRMASPKELRAQVAVPAIAHAGPVVDDAMPSTGGFVIPRRWQVIISVLVVLGLIALLVSQLY
ncbi:MAG: hypothetical protein WBA46_10545 [Thermomicrobiales bacterium]